MKSTIRIMVKQQKMSAIKVGIIGLCFVIYGVFAGNWFNRVTPTQIQQCENAVKRLYPQQADQAILLPKCDSHLMVENMLSPDSVNLPPELMVDTLNIIHVYELGSMFYSVFLIGSGILILVTSYRISRRNRALRICDSYS